jgi:ribosomal protein L35
LYKSTIGKNVDESIKIQADLGYLGIDKIHANSLLPIKASKSHKLTKKEEAYNKRLARQRVVIEHIHAKIKTFKIVSYPYRNRRRRHLLRMSLICGIINFENPKR